MVKLEFFNKILETTALVCNVPILLILDGCRKEDVCLARSIVVFWCNALGFSCESLLTLVGKSHKNSIKSIEKNIEYYWTHKFIYHMLVKEVGESLLNYIKSIGEEFDITKPIKHISKVTNKYYQSIK